MRWVRVLGFLAFCFIASSVLAANFTYTVTGTYPQIPTGNQYFHDLYANSPLIADNQPFSIQFNISGVPDSQYTYTNVNDFGWFRYNNVPITFLLNGQSVATTPVAVEFAQDLSQSYTDLFVIFSDGTTVWHYDMYNWNPGKFWTGLPTSPQFSTGTFTNLGAGVDTFGVYWNVSENPWTLEVVESQSTVPEPSGFLLLGGGLAAVLTQLRRKP